MSTQTDIVFYGDKTAHAPKVAIALEELKLNYKKVRLSIDAKENKSPEFRKVSITTHLPALTDKTGGSEFHIAESNAILFYLAEKYGPHLTFPHGTNEFFEVSQWLDFATDFGFTSIVAIYLLNPANNPDLGKSPMIEGAIMGRITHYLNVLDSLLKQQKEKYGVDEPYLIGNKFTIADISLYVTLDFLESDAKIGHADFEELKAWKSRIGSRDSVKRGHEVAHWFSHGRDE